MVFHSFKVGPHLITEEWNRMFKFLRNLISLRHLNVSVRMHGILPLVNLEGGCFVLIPFWKKLFLLFMIFWKVQFIHLFHPSLNTCPYICTGRFINIPAPFPVVEWLSKASEVYILRGPEESSFYWVLHPVSHGSVQGTVSHFTDISWSYMYECGILHLEDCSNYQYK